jgi:hypothetical protein
MSSAMARMPTAGVGAKQAISPWIRAAAARRGGHDRRSWRGTSGEQHVFRESGAAVAVDGARKAWYFSGGILALAVAVALGMFCAYLVISLGMDVLAVRRDLMSFPKDLWIAVVLKVPLILASFWLARRFSVQTYRLWNVASTPAEPGAADILSGLERAKQSGALRVGVAARSVAPEAAAAGTTAASPARRMAELKGCLDAGMISAEEYEAKRADILRSL